MMEASRLTGGATAKVRAWHASQARGVPGGGEGILTCRMLVCPRHHTRLRADGRLEAATPTQSRLAALAARPWEMLAGSRQWADQPGQPDTLRGRRGRAKSAECDAAGASSRRRYGRRCPDDGRAGAGWPTEPSHQGFWNGDYPEGPQGSAAVAWPSPPAGQACSQLTAQQSLCTSPARV